MVGEKPLWFSGFLPRMSPPPGWWTASLESCSRLSSSFTSTLWTPSAEGQKGENIPVGFSFNLRFQHTFSVILWDCPRSSLICPLLSWSCRLSCFRPSSLVSRTESQEVTDRKWTTSWKSRSF